MNRTQVLDAFRKAWQQRAARERRLLTLGLVVLLLAAFWQWGLAPAWSTWQQAPQREARLAETTHRMQQWQLEARQLQAPARPDRVKAFASLQARIELLGEGARLNKEGEQLRVQLQAAPAAGLAQWLSLAREQAGAMPQQADLQRVDDKTSVAWKGSLTLRLP